MAITHAMSTSFKVEFLDGMHAFGATVARADTTPDTFMLALYLVTANLDSTTTAYTATGEVSSTGTGYPAGGLPLVVTPPTSTGTTAFLDFADLTFSNVTLTAHGALIYNASQNGRAVGVLNFGSDKTAVAGDFIIIFPTPDAANAIIRIV